MNMNTPFGIPYSSLSPAQQQNLQGLAANFMRGTGASQATANSTFGIMPTAQPAVAPAPAAPSAPASFNPGITAGDFQSNPAAGLGSADPNIRAAAGIYQGQPQQPSWMNQLRFAAGGSVPWFVRKEADYHPGGLFKATTPGRQDVLNKSVPAGSYIIPADVVSGIGEGNTMAGAKALDSMMHSLPYGVQKQKFARGGTVPIKSAGGEYCVPPHVVAAVGKGDPKRGADALDRFVVKMRQKAASKMKSLPGPRKQ